MCGHRHRPRSRAWDAARCWCLLAAVEERVHGRHRGRAHELLLSTAASLTLRHDAAAEARCGQIKANTPHHSARRSRRTPLWTAWQGQYTELRGTVWGARIDHLPGTAPPLAGARVRPLRCFHVAARLHVVGFPPVHRAEEARRDLPVIEDAPGCCRRPTTRCLRPATAPKKSRSACPRRSCRRDEPPDTHRRRGRTRRSDRNTRCRRVRRGAVGTVSPPAGNRCCHPCRKIHAALPPLRAGSASPPPPPTHAPPTSRAHRGPLGVRRRVRHPPPAAVRRASIRPSPGGQSWVPQMSPPPRRRYDDAVR